MSTLVLGFFSCWFKIAPQKCVKQWSWSFFFCFFSSAATQSRQLAGWETIQLHPHLQKCCAGSKVARWHLPLGGHMEFTCRRQKRERSNSACRGPSIQAKALLPALFTSGVEHQLYANFYRAAVLRREQAGSLSKAGNSPSCRCLLIVRRWSSGTVLLK